MAMSKQDFVALADVLRRYKPTTDSDAETGTFCVPGPTHKARLQQWELMTSALADFCQSQNPRFMRDRWLGYIAGENGKNGGTVKKAPYQPKTGAKCGCKPGIQRDNCPSCEGTGMLIDFAAIRARR
jgi:hypothetical protein